MGEHADLWHGELVERKNIKIFKSSELRLEVAIKILRPRGRQRSSSRAKLEEVLFPLFPVSCEELIPFSPQALEEHGRLWKTLRHPNVGRFYGLASDLGTMPALILDFYPNGNVNEFVKNHALEDGSKLYLVGISVISSPATLILVRPDLRDCARYAILA